MKKQTGFKAKLIDATIRLGKKKLLKEKMTIFEKLLNLLVDVLVRKKIKKTVWRKFKSFYFWRRSSRQRNRRISKLYWVTYPSRLWPEQKLLQ